VTLRLGARGSALSLAQATLVQNALGGPSAVEIVKVRTTGDRLSAAGAPIEWKGDFTRELDQALQDLRIDFAVHSLKDVPSAIPEGLALAAVPVREDPSDVLVSRPRRTFAALPPGSRIGTASPRRRAQILAARPDLRVLEARGNVDTRIRKLGEGVFDAIVLAQAGLRRLGRADEITEVFPDAILLSAVAQGALGIVTRADDRRTREILQPLDHAASHAEVRAERAFLSTLEAGCRAPVAGRARVDGSRIRLAGGVFAPDGSRLLRQEREGGAAAPEELGRSLAEALLALGASAFIAEAGA
jgi:hydroxymethylbilane synthase